MVLEKLTILTRSKCGLAASVVVRCCKPRDMSSGEPAAGSPGAAAGSNQGVGPHFSSQKVSPHKCVYGIQIYRVYKQ